MLRIWVLQGRKAMSDQPTQPTPVTPVTPAMPEKPETPVTPVTPAAEFRAKQTAPKTEQTV